MFWTALGLGAGVTAAVLASRWMRKKATAVAPAAIGRQAAEGLGDLGRLIRESASAARRAMQERESEIRGALDETG
jgi:hypothetical protein